MKIKLNEPEEVEHHYFAIRIIRKKSGKWYVTLAKDAIVIWQSRLYSTKKWAINSILKHGV